MKILIIHNKYAISGRGSGEEIMIGTISDLLKSNGHEVTYYFRSSFELGNRILGKVRAFFSGIYNPFERKKVARLIVKTCPDVVFIQNLYPLISPSVLLACKDSGVPVVMRVPNYRLLCPTGLFLRDGHVCEKCLGGKEYNCFVHNCEKNWVKSLGYSLRGYWSNKRKYFRDNVDVFMTLTEFAKKKLIQGGISQSRITVISGIASQSNLAFDDTSDLEGSYVGFVGRISKEKGLDVLIDCAKRTPEIPYKIAGETKGWEVMVNTAPSNVEFLGQLDSSQLSAFYQGSRFMLVTSTWYEGLPSVCMESMLAGKAVVCSDIGGLSEVIRHNENGLLFDVGSPESCAAQISKLWNDQELGLRLGRNGKQLSQTYYGEEQFLERLLIAITLAKKNIPSIMDKG